MAKYVEDREDLLRDASGYVQRVELRIPGVDHEVFCGFRDQGAFSVYWGQDAVFQFNSDGELRRAFWQARMVASYKRQLNWLAREAEPEVNSARMRLRRWQLSAEELAACVAFVGNCLTTLEEAISTGTHIVVGEFPANADVCGRISEWLDRQADTVRFAVHPGAG